MAGVCWGVGVRMLTHKLDSDAVALVMSRTEGHFFDYKSRRISPAKLCQTVCAFANADGGEVLVGIEDPSKGGSWDGFQDEEACNGHIQVISSIFPLSDGVRIEFLMSDFLAGLVLRIEVAKSSEIRRTTDGKVYVRRGAQNLSLKSDDEVERLKFNKGIISFEDFLTPGNPVELTGSDAYIRFSNVVVPRSDPRLQTH